MGVDVGEPLRGRHAEPAGHDEPERAAVKQRDGPVVHRVCNEDVAERDFARDAAEELRHGAGRRVVGRLHPEMTRRCRDAGALEQRRERHPRPRRGADRTVLPLDAGRLRQSVDAASVAGTLERYRSRLRAHLPDLVECEGHGTLYLAVDGERPGERKLGWRAEVAAHEKVLGRRLERRERRDRCLGVERARVADDEVARRASRIGCGRRSGCLSEEPARGERAGRRHAEREPLSPAERQQAVSLNVLVLARGRRRRPRRFIPTAIRHTDSSPESSSDGARGGRIVRWALAEAVAQPTYVADR